METGKMLESLTKDGRKAHPMARGLIDYFPDALAAVANVSYVGNEQHNPGEELHWARGKSNDQADCLIRHLVARGTKDDDGLRHTAKVAWRALAMLQLEIEGEEPKCANWVEFLKEVGLYRPPVDDDFVPPRQRTYYIAGPMRGYVDHNFPEFDRVQRMGDQLGYHMISPASLDRKVGIDGKTQLTDDQLQDCIDRDVSAIMELDPKTDGVVVLNGWSESVGASAEVALAVWRGLEVIQEDFETIQYHRRHNNG